MVRRIKQKKFELYLTAIEFDNILADFKFWYLQTVVLSLINMPLLAYPWGKYNRYA